MISNRTALRALALATAMTAFAAPAAAQRVDRIVAFGDSYADTGNFFKFVNINPQTGTSGAYTTGRFSGGTNYIDTLSRILNVPVDNFAIAGALTNNYNTNTGANLGFPTEVGSFLSGGAGLTPFPAVSGTFGANDLLAISIGGNDGRLYQKGSVNNGTPGPIIPPGTLAGAPAAGAASAAAATAGLNALVARGAPTISYLAGSTANIPEVALQPNPATAFAIRDAYYQSYDAAMRNTLAGYAANGEIVHYLDLNLIIQKVQSNYAAYGLTGLACPALPNPACILSTAEAAKYVFYFDQLHLTSAGFAIVAKYVAVQLEAPLTFSAVSDNALDTSFQWGRTLTSRMDLAAPRDGDQPEGMRLFVVGDTLTRKMHAGERNEQFRSSTKGATIGAEFGFGSGMAGIAANYSKPEVNFGNDAAGSNSHSIQVGGFASFGMAGLFAQGYIGAGWDKYKLVRRGVVDDMTARPSGNHMVGGAKAGYLIPMGSVRVGPIVALDYARAKVNGYTESGDAALTLNVDKIRYTGLRGNLGAELRGDFGGGGVQLRPYVSAVAEKDFKGDGRTFYFSQTSAPTIVNHYAVDDNSKKIYTRVTTGASAQIFSNVGLDVSLSGTFGKKNGDETSAHVGLNFGF
ncbi:MAG: autotransporter domain-containing protein [Sphingomicrobium sp.]